jgi:hypothetical protein
MVCGGTALPSVRQDAVAYFKVNSRHSPGKSEYTEEKLGGDLKHVTGTVCDEQFVRSVSGTYFKVELQQYSKFPGL